QRAREVLSLDPAAANSAYLGQIHCLPRGELGRFTNLGGTSAWVHVSRCTYAGEVPLAQCYCGTDSASMCVLGESATAVGAVIMRMEVLQYMLSRKGRAIYGSCQEHEKEQPWS